MKINEIIIQFLLQLQGKYLFWKQNSIRNIKFVIYY